MRTNLSNKSLISVDSTNMGTQPLTVIKDERIERFGATNIERWYYSLDI
jgi:hypothetical protein